MKFFTAVAISGLLALLAVPATGLTQNETSAEASADAPPEDPLAKIFGEGGMDLKCQRMESIMGEQSGQLENMRMKGGVDIKSEQMDLKCDELDIDMEKQMMIAKGKIVQFVQNEVEGTCGRLEYDIETGKTILSGLPKPSIVQTDVNGRVTRTSANMITLSPVEGGGSSVALDGDAEVKVQPNTAATAKANDDSTSRTKKTARQRKVTPKNVKDLKSPSVGR